MERGQDRVGERVAKRPAAAAVVVPLARQRRHRAVAAAAAVALRGGLLRGACAPGHAAHRLQVVQGALLGRPVKARVHSVRRHQRRAAVPAGLDTRLAVCPEGRSVPAGLRRRTLVVCRPRSAARPPGGVLLLAGSARMPPPGVGRAPAPPGAGRAAGGAAALRAAVAVPPRGASALGGRHHPCAAGAKSAAADTAGRRDSRDRRQRPAPPRGLCGGDILWRRPVRRLAGGDAVRRWREGLRQPPPDRGGPWLARGRGRPGAAPHRARGRDALGGGGGGLRRGLGGGRGGGRARRCRQRPGRGVAQGDPGDPPRQAR
mmetsp:Transcript_70845/g.196140  ORF Transcript_70845/g.196140 Transcript_70845/m.196140 type:complete len:317 (-) Transcript_70845:369-1319(-)